MRCLVTGASGHLGSYLARRLLSEGHEVTALVRTASDLWRLAGVLNHVSLIRAELANIEQAAPAIADSRPEAVFHLAWQGVASDAKNDLAHVTSNVWGSLRLFEAARSAGCNL